MNKRQLLWVWIMGLLLLGSASGFSVTADGSAELSTDTKYVALTFDDGPKPGTTDVLLDGLRARGAAATFFLIGEQAEQYPDLVRRMQQEGHQVGNHTWSHVRLEGASEETMREEVERTEGLLAQLLGGSGYWLRPPYGQVRAGTEPLIGVPMVKWSVDPRDWESRDAEKVTEAVLEAVRPNSIILLHDIYPSSVEAALRIVDELREDGYWFVTAEELLRLGGITPRPGALYRSGAG